MLQPGYDKNSKSEKYAHQMMKHDRFGNLAFISPSVIIQMSGQIMERLSPNWEQTFNTVIAQILSRHHTYFTA